MSNTILKIEDLTKKYGKNYALNHINLEIHEGEIIGLIGPNGAGKTTILKLIARLIKPNVGKILIQNKQGNLQDIIKNSKNLIEMGFLIDVPIFRNTTPYRLLNYIGNIRNYPRKELKKRIFYLLYQFELFDWRYKKIKTFSKGMIQKLGFIVAIINDPKLIILDEPQSGLDPSARVKVRDFLKSLQKEGKTIFVSSHLLYEIGEVCDKIALINKGLIIGFETIENLNTLLRRKELICEILNPLPVEKVKPLIEKMNARLNHYMKPDLNLKDTKDKISYDPEKTQFVILYTGRKEDKSKILEILYTDFQSNFTIQSYFEPKTSQLEQLYFQELEENKNITEMKG